MARDPVCGREVDEQNWLAKRGEKATYQDQTYYFCGLMCKQKFIMNPAKYLETAEGEG
ncbi:MAG: YHS domain-containing protein [Chloroflexota bacterium]|nr:YHS domain-containing protein [Chloroflexota bacterium]